MATHENIYGGQTYINSSFVFDKIYANTQEAKAGAATDGVLLGRYILIKYCNILFDDNAKSLIESNKISEFNSDEEKRNAEVYLQNFQADGDKSYDRTVWRKVWNDADKTYRYEPIAYLSTTITNDAIEALQRDLNSFNQFFTNEQGEAGIDTLKEIQQALQNSAGYKTEQNGEIFNAYGETADEDGIIPLNKALGEFSHAEGNNTTTQRKNAHAEGQNTTTLGSHAHAENFSSNKALEIPDIEIDGKIYSPSQWNRDTPNADVIAVWKKQKFAVAKGSPSHIEGSNCIAIGNNSHAEGRETIAGGENGASGAYGAYAHSEGYLTWAKGEASHAEGKDTVASTYAHAEGHKTKAEGYASHAGGQESDVSDGASYGFAHGYSVKTNHNCAGAIGKALTTGLESQFVVGAFNKVANNALFVVGNGTAQYKRANAFEVLQNGSFVGTPQLLSKTLVNNNTPIFTYTENVKDPVLNLNGNYYLTANQYSTQFELINPIMFKFKDGVAVEQGNSVFLGISFNSNILNPANSTKAISQGSGYAVIASESGQSSILLPTKFYLEGNELHWFNGETGNIKELVILDLKIECENTNIELK